MGRVGSLQLENRLCIRIHTTYPYLLVKNSLGHLAVLLEQLLPY